MPLDGITAPPPEIPLLTGHGATVAKLTIELTEHIARETAFLKERRPREAQKLHGGKSRLMAEYRDAMGKLKVNEHLLGSKDSQERKYLRKLTDELRVTLRDHARIVLRLKSVAEGLIKSVGEEVAKKNQPVTAYGKNAAFARSKQSTPTSLSLNQII